MLQIPAQETEFTKLLEWLNANIPPHVYPITAHKDLADGTALLCLLANIDPTIGILCTSIIHKPADEADVISNLSLLASVLSKMTPSFHLDVPMIQAQTGKLALGESGETLRLLLYLYNSLGKQEFAGDKSCKIEQDDKTTQMEGKTQCSFDSSWLNSSRDVKEEVQADDISQLHKLRSKLKEVNEILKGNLASKHKVKQIQGIINDSLNPQSSQTSKRRSSKMLTGYAKLRPQDIHILTNPEYVHHLKKIPHETNEIQIVRQLFSKIINFKNSKAAIEDPHGLLHNIGFFTFEVLKNISNQIQLTNEQITLIQNYSNIYTIYQSFAYLFFGIKQPGAFQKKYDFKEEPSFKYARRDLRTYCQRYYQSTILVKRVLLASSILMRTKLNFFRFLSNIELLPSKRLKRIDFLSPQYRCYETQNDYEQPQEVILSQSQSESEDNISQVGSYTSSQYYNPKNSGVFQYDKDSVINQSILEVDDDESSKAFQNQPVVSSEIMTEKVSQNVYEIVDDVISTERRPFPLYWSEHRKVLIAFEVKHVYNKKPDFQDKDSLTKFISSKAHERSQFDGGFLFPAKKNRMTIDFVKIINESDKYPHLKILFRQEIETPLSWLRLRQFVKIMLDLKHHSIVKEFLEIYDVIVGEVKVVPFQKVQKPSDRFAVVDTITKKAERGVSRINDYFVNTYDMKDDSAEVAKLLRVTVYCFLAEFHTFNENQFYVQAFDFPKVDKKLSTNIVIYQKATGKKDRPEKI